MKIHYLQHVPFENPGHILAWAARRGHAVTRSLLYANDPPPAAAAYDLLVVMGGPMGAYDERDHPWLVDEKRCIQSAISSGKRLMGICLGAQLIACVLGARVAKNRHREIGWFDVALTGAGRASPILTGFPNRFAAFHWHGDTFDIPAGAQHLMSSEACAHQAFAYDGRVIGLQCHLESDLAGVHNLVEHGAAEMIAGPYVQDARETLRQAPAVVPEINLLLERMLDAWTLSPPSSAGCRIPISSAPHVY